MSCHVVSRHDTRLDSAWLWGRLLSSVSRSVSQSVGRPGRREGRQAGRLDVWMSLDGRIDDDGWIDVNGWLAGGRRYHHDHIYSALLPTRHTTTSYMTALNSKRIHNHSPRPPPYPAIQGNTRQYNTTRYAHNNTQHTHIRTRQAQLPTQRVRPRDARLSGLPSPPVVGDNLRALSRHDWFAAVKRGVSVCLRIGAWLSLLALGNVTYGRPDHTARTFDPRWTHTYVCMYVHKSP